MDVTREVILDLLPVYLAGEASPATRALVESFLEQDRELAQRIRLQMTGGLAKAIPSHVPPDLELRSLHRTRRLLGLQRWLFGFAIACTSIGLALEISFTGGHVRVVRFVMFDHPRELGAFLLVGLCCWLGYFGLRRRLRTSLR